MTDKDVKKVENGPHLDSLDSPTTQADDFLDHLQNILQKIDFQIRRLAVRACDMGLLLSDFDLQAEISVEQIVDAVLVGLAPIDPANIIPDPRIAELEGALAKARAENDNANAKIAKLEAGIVDAVAADPIPEVQIKRPKRGATLSLPKKSVVPSSVFEALAEGALFQVVLADGSSSVLPCAMLVGGVSMFEACGHDGEKDSDARILLTTAIKIEAEDDRVAVREAWLLDSHGNALSMCRLSSDLVGGGGLEAMIGAKHFVFRFGE